MTTEKKESATQAVKRVLKEQGYEVVSCKYGTGTASWWIHTTVIYPDNLPPMLVKRDNGSGYDHEYYSNAYSDFRSKVAWEAQKAAGRGHLEDDIQTDLFMVCMNTDVISRADHEANLKRRADHKAHLLAKTTCTCGTKGVYTRHNDRYYRIYECPACKRQWRA